MIEKIDHIGIAVADLDESLASYKRIYGLVPIKMETMKESGLRIAFLKIGEVLVELLEPPEPGVGRIGKFIADYGEGIEHMAFRVDNLDREMDRLRNEQIEMRDKTPREGADESRIAYIEPAYTQNVLTELVERKREVT